MQRVQKLKPLKENPSKRCLARRRQRAAKRLRDAAAQDNAQDPAPSPVVVASKLVFAQTRSSVLLRLTFTHFHAAAHHAHLRLGIACMSQLGS